MAEINKRPQCNVLYLSHGGGPLPLLGDPGHQEMKAVLEKIASMIARPSAIIVISAHWEARIATITASEQQPLIYDYAGFPEQAYTIQYPAPGKPELAYKVFQLLQDNGIEASLDAKRGFDHGLYVPLKIMYPQADISCIQLSLLSSLNPAEHIRLGEALANLDMENLLIIGSGFSFHNMRAFFTANTAESIAQNEAFEQWLIETCTSRELDEKTRTSRLTNWEEAPAARYCHPREEHLLPLHVCYGFAKGPCSDVFELTIMQKKASMYLWQI